MKIRSGFVSNSSSSSFIIAFKESDKCKHCGRGDVDILDLIRSSNDSETEVYAEGGNAIVSEVFEWLEGVVEIFKEIEALENEGYKTAYVTVSFHNEMLNDLIQYDETGNIKIIYKEV